MTSVDQGIAGACTASGRRMRIAYAVLALAGALVLTGCGGDGDSRGGSAPSTTPSAPAAPAAPTTPGSGGAGSGSDDGGAEATGVPTDKLEGSWFTTVGGKAVALMFTGDQAALFAMGGTMCSGTAREDTGASTISLECADGRTDRTSGTIDLVSGSTLEVTWEGPLGTETFTKAEGGRLPQGLPTAGPAS